MDFTHYPFDRQVSETLGIKTSHEFSPYTQSQECKFEVRSYSHVQDMIAFELYEFDDQTQNAATVLDYEVSLKPMQNYTVGDYSYVGFVIEMDRYASKYFVNYYLPSIVFVMVSWVSFIIPIDIVPGRMGMLVTMLLVLINQFGTVVDIQPPSKSQTAITVWFIECIVFVAGALVAYATLLFQKAKFRKACQINIWNTKPMFNQPIGPSGKKTERNETSKGAQTMEQLDLELAGWDLKFLLVFPLAFTICNMIYWPIVMLT